MSSQQKVCLSKNLESLIQSRGLSMSQLSARASINKSTIHNYINGVLPQGLVALLKLCDFFEISLTELVFGEICDREGLSSVSTSIDKQERYEVVIKKIIQD